MKYVNSGRGQIPFISLVAILSISLIVNLPGLAVSPLLGKLKDVFPHVTELETQLLVTLPNLIIIPFILWSGKLCNLNNQLRILTIGLIIYIASGILFLLASSMAQLIVLSCLLGIGCGLCIPLAASLIAQNFQGAARTKQLGMKSGVSNFTVIFATLFVGLMASKGWHLAFIVYLVPIIPLCLVPFMSRKFIDKYSKIDPTKVVAAPVPAKSEAKSKISLTKNDNGFSLNFFFPDFKIFLILLGVIGLYIVMTYSTMVVSDYIPFTMKHYGMNTSEVGIATAMFFFAATMAGFFLTLVIKICKNFTPYLGIGLCILGLYACGFVHNYIVYLGAILFIGFGYGLLQPIIYDKTAFIAPTAEKSTEYFAYTLTGNYIAIAIVPFVVDLLCKIFSQSTLNFPYILNGSILLAVICLGFYKCKSFVFNMKGVGQAEETEAKSSQK